MATKRTPKADTTTLRRCKGSVTFGIEAHDAPVSEFPVQPSRKDGLGTMCKTHWREYTSALRKASLARKAGESGGGEPGDMTVGEHQDLVAAEDADRREAIGIEAAKGRAKRAAAKAQPVPAPDPELLAAKALVDSIDRMPAPEAVIASGTDEAQAALALVADASLGGRTRTEEAAIA